MASHCQGLAAICPREGRCRGEESREPWPWDSLGAAGLARHGTDTHLGVSPARGQGVCVHPTPSVLSFLGGRGGCLLTSWHTVTFLQFSHIFAVILHSLWCVKFILLSCILFLKMLPFPLDLL